MVPETLQQMFDVSPAQWMVGCTKWWKWLLPSGGVIFRCRRRRCAGRDAAEVEAHCDRCPAQRHPEIRRGFPVSGRQRSSGYSFLHALCRDALYRKVPAGRRSRLHGMLARAEERLYASDPKRIAAELAGHLGIFPCRGHCPRLRFCAWPRTAPIPASPRKKPCGIWSAHSPWSNGCVRTIGPRRAWTCSHSAHCCECPTGTCKVRLWIIRSWCRKPACPAPGIAKAGRCSKASTPS